jgi:cell division initiation protein
MAYTPVEIRHIRFRRGLFGYSRGAVDRVLAEITDSFENVWRERADLEDKVEQLEGELARHRDLESLLRATLTSAEKAAHELKDEARRKARLILEEAHAGAREITRESVAERERLVADARRVRALLASALEVVDEAQEPGGESPERRAA